MPENWSEDFSLPLETEDYHICGSYHTKIQIILAPATAALNF